MEASCSHSLIPDSLWAQLTFHLPTQPSRRSTSSLSRLVISPLSSIAHPEISSVSNADQDSPTWQRHTYIAGKSKPTTPGILSRDGSTIRLNSKSYTHLAFSADTFLAHDGGRGGREVLSKSKSTTLLHPPGGALTQQKKKKLRYGLPRSATAVTDDGEWFFRAGAAITNEARESKGQSWLVSRESSTSLVALDDDEEKLATQDGAQERVTFSPRYSRNTSRAASARTSRRPSGTGSRPDLTFFTPLAPRTPVRELMSGHHDYFGDLRESSAAMVTAAGPDFVDAQDEEDEGSDVDEELRERLAEAEVAKLAQRQGYGLGGLVDRLIGWTLFDVGDEAGEGDEEDDDVQAIKRTSRTSGQVRIRKGSVAEEVKTTDRVTTSPPEGMKPIEDVKDGDIDGQGGWSDAAWLLSVAAKVLL